MSAIAMQYVLATVLVVGLMLIVLKFLHWRSCVRVILLSNSLIMPLLNLISFSAISCFYSLIINLALNNLPYLVFTDSLSAKNRVLLVYKPTIPKGLLLYNR